MNNKLVLILLASVLVSLTHARQDEDTRIKKLESRIKSLEKKTGPRVMFTARLGSPKKILTKGRVHFDSILVNIGGGYNVHTGYFTAPVSGIYEFNLHIMTRDNGAPEYCIRTEKEIKTCVKIAEPWETTTGVAIFHVKAGGLVWVQKSWEYGTNVALHYGVWNQFSGYLYQRD